MEDWLPSYQDGSLRIPGQGDRFAELVLSRHLGDENDSTFLVSVALGESLRATTKIVQLECAFPLAHVWKDIPEGGGERGNWGPWRSEYDDFRVSINHDGLGHFEMMIHLEIGACEFLTLVETRVMVEAGWLPRVSGWWRHFFENPQPK